jgi:hypothetical protein
MLRRARSVNGSHIDMTLRDSPSGPAAPASKLQEQRACPCDLGDNETLHGVRQFQTSRPTQHGTEPL